MLKIYSILLLLLLMWIQYHLWLGAGGVLEQHELERLVEKQEKSNRALAQRNRMLEAEVGELKQGLQAVEERARLELGMVKKSETFYQIIELGVTQLKSE